MMHSESVLEEQRPWAFSRAQLTAGLRSHTGDNKLTIRELKEFDLPDRRPAVGRIRGLQVVCQGSAGKSRFTLVLKEPQGTTRAGMAGAGRREVSFYRCLAEQIPVEVPRLLAAETDGNWMVFDYIQASTASELWEADHYRTAIDHLVTLHDRFWLLEQDLDIYNWLGRPLSRDFEIYLQAATKGIQRLLDQETLQIFVHQPAYLGMLEDLVNQAGDVASELKSIPCTLLHGDYWPGNLISTSDDTMAVVDWQHASIGPGILDLVKFSQASRWHFTPLPVTQTEINLRYRNQLRSKNGYAWTDADWNRHWDYALMWIFLTDWVDLLSHIPNSILATRQSDIESIWFEPVHKAIRQHLTR